MSIQYSDGSFSQTLPYEKLMERFSREMEENKPIKALFFGTPQEVEKEKEKIAIEKRIDELEQRVREMAPVKTFLEIPTPDEVRRFTQKI